MKYLFLSILFFIGLSTKAQIIYVSPNGIDAANGSQDKPIKSLRRAFDLSKEAKDKNVTIKVASGKYLIDETLQLTSQYSRPVDKGISVVGDENNPPVFYGGIKLEPKLEKASGNWILHIPASNTTALSLTINGNLVPIASTHKEPFFNITNLEYSKLKDSSIVKITIPDSLNQILKKTPKDQWKNLYANFYVRWTNVIAKVIDYSYSESYVKIKIGKIPNHLLINKKSRFKILNITDELQKGDWYYKNSETIVYKPKDSDKISSAEIYYSTVDKLITVEGNPNNYVNGISFSNLIFDTAGKKMNSNGFFSHQAAEELEAVIELNYAKNISFNNIQIRNVLTNAIWFNKLNENNSLKNSIIQNNGAGSIKVGDKSNKSEDLSSKIVIENCLVENGGIVYPSAPAIIVLQAKNSIIKHNEIRNYGYTGISIGMRHSPLGFPVNNYVGYNSIDNIGRGELDDMAGIYTLGGSDSTTIYNNVITNVKALNYGGHGLYTDEGSKDIILKNNLVLNCSHAGYHTNIGYGIQFINNYLVNNSVGLESWHFGNGSLVASKNLLLNNLIPENEEWQKILKSSSNNNTIINDSSLKVNSLKSFTNVVNNDFKLNSKGIDKIDFNNVGVLK